MSVQTFIPEIWAARLLSSLKKSLVYASPIVTNRDYEGEINEAGDTVTINSVNRPTIGTYTPNSTTITPEPLTTAQRKLVVDQAKYFAFELDNVDRRQAKGGLLEEATDEAAYGLRDVADQYVAGLYTGVASANDLGTVSITSADLAYTNLVSLKTKLDEADVPMEGRWVVIPPWYEGLLLENSKFVEGGTTDSEGRLVNGVVGEAAGFRVLKSNNVPNPTGDDHVVIAGVRGAITFAEQINSLKAYEPDDSFSDAIKGLHLYGSKLVRPDSIATLTASIT